MAYSFDPSFFDEGTPSNKQGKTGSELHCPLTGAMPAHYAWLSINPHPTVTPIQKPTEDHHLSFQKHQQSLIDKHGLDEQELQMMRQLKAALKEESKNLMARVSLWLEAFDPTLNLHNDPKHNASRKPSDDINKH